ncbi:unnamed protein product [Pleuronectes platessa]|uniref:Uncharacterized protein n=1 Tax=Pleuronectes platessa TaxID=8262 RepID=A0A9N7UQR4_PLEPL|nr:unnamed protein product [Pleuronectes platessa]
MEPCESSLTSALLWAPCAPVKMTRLSHAPSQQNKTDRIATCPAHEMYPAPVQECVLSCVCSREIPREYVRKTLILNSVPLSKAPYSPKICSPGAVHVSVHPVGVEQRPVGHVDKFEVPVQTNTTLS